MSACHRAFAITELQEEILLNLPLNELLRTFQVCRSWATSTRRIRQALFLEPTNRLLDLEGDKWKLHVDPPTTENATIQHSTLTIQDMDLSADQEDDLDYEDDEMDTDDVEVLEYDEDGMGTDEDERSEYGSSSVDDTEVEVAEPTSTTLDPLIGPILNPFINIFLYPENSTTTLRSLGIVTVPRSEDDDDASLPQLGQVDVPKYLIWKLAGSPSSFQDPEASWQKMQVMQPATTEMRAICTGLEVELDSKGIPRDFQFVTQEDGELDSIQVESYGGEYWVKSSTGVTLGQWVEMYQRHHAVCPYCVFMADEEDEDYGRDAPFDRWSFKASRFTRKLEPVLASGREDFVASPDGDHELDQLVVPGSGFTGHYVLASAGDVTRPVSVPDEGGDPGV